ncbi:hypothetical protein [Xenorhabdus ishibashii]|uniref:hypothetical protein n=1 Tax=Xenorhabdus ishibashii TaxID=1034471 RepID=UPI000C043E41|nr:hypothetical protein [Xenorhabdus ishibashii]
MFRINDTYQLHFSALSQNQTATAAFRAEKEAYSKVETNDPVTPIPFLRPKERRKPINNFDADMEKYTSIWFKNGKRIVSEILML